MTDILVTDFVAKISKALDLSLVTGQIVILVFSGSGTEMFFGYQWKISLSTNFMTRLATLIQGLRFSKYL